MAGLATPGLWNWLNWLNLDLEIVCQGCSVSDRVNGSPCPSWAVRGWTRGSLVWALDTRGFFPSPAWEKQLSIPLWRGRLRARVGMGGLLGVTPRGHRSDLTPTSCSRGYGQEGCCACGCPLPSPCFVLCVCDRSVPLCPHTPLFTKHENGLVLRPRRPTAAPVG